ncbi:hypothetical protein C1645_726575 [Glomus cerebriforme]|uniref:NADH dehydrogenase [ubiquinone] 1 alpha subcomplex subunit 13 n=1 Tax=Glomus cerebriforme TaxID=658196 RepID=A0A397SRV3_9GLOM|nr:hypothetical protein C1645_726575 [Glomus cerebriforme]
MASTPQIQDLPRPGGFPAVQYKRNIPRRGPSGLALFTGITAISALGFYWMTQTILESRELKREKNWSRIHLIPMLQAEFDRDTYRRAQASLQREAEIMKDVPDWKIGESVYNSKRYVPPSVFVLPEK